MAYVAVRGGREAIDASIERLESFRRMQPDGLRQLVDQVMSEASLYDEEVARLAILQAEGSPEEAVFLLRAYRSTLARSHRSRVADTREMFVERRISASFKDIPGGQILGASPDYSHRLINFDLLDEDDDERERWLDDYRHRLQHSEVDNGGDPLILERLPKVVDYLRSEGLMVSHEQDDSEPRDVTKEGLVFPTARSSRLQVLTRGQTGAVTALGYASLRGWGSGSVHPTVGELRVGLVPISVSNGVNDDPDDSYYIGEIRVTEVETFIPVSVDLGHGKHQMEFEIGYGLCYGQNETKTISMSLLDHNLEAVDDRFPTHDQEFVLFHVDSVEATGFISHLKLPHYVTFQAKLDSLRRIRTEKESSNEA